MSRKRNKKNKNKDSLVTPEKCWESELQVSKGEKCPHLTAHDDPKIIVPYEIWHQIMALTKELDTEWLGYLGGSRLQTGEWKVTGITVPKQEVTGSTVKPTDTIQAEGVVHSHVNMGCFFSGVDDDYLNENHDFSIVVNKRDSNKAVVRIKLPCGAFSIIEAEVVLEYPGCPDISEFIEEAKKNIDEEETAVVVTPYTGKTWNQKKGVYEWNSVNKDAAETIDTMNAKKDDLGVPDYNPKLRQKNYKGWDYNEYLGGY